MQQQPDRQALTAEVLEMGEQLFDLVLMGHTQNTITGFEGHKKNNEGMGESYPVEELRAASSEFFTSLRLLLHSEQA